jgi:glycosyltransferase involved in cell wall biosynthesis
MELNKIGKEYILITCTNFPDGGAGANYLNLFCRGLKENQRTVKVWLLKGHAFGSHKTSNKRKNISKEGVPFTYLGFPNRPVFKIIKIFEEIIAYIRLIVYLIFLIKKRHSTHILLYNNEVLFNIPIFLFSKLSGIKIISFISEYYDKSNFNSSFLRKLKWYGFQFNFFYLNKKSYRLIVFSQFLKEQYLKQGVSEDTIIIQPNLTDFNFWYSGNNSNTYTFGYSGTPTIKDGVEDLLKSVSKLNGYNIFTTLLIIGDNNFGESLIPELKKLCELLNISSQVTFTGLVNSEQVKEYLSECKILTLTRPNIIQTQAGFPTKLGEYIASGKQVLTTNFGDIEKYFTPMKEIVTAECGNIEDISNRLKWMIENPEDAERIRAAGYNRAKEFLSYEKSIIRILEKL